MCVVALLGASPKEQSNSRVLSRDQWTRSVGSGCHGAAAPVIFSLRQDGGAGR